MPVETPDTQNQAPPDFDSVFPEDNLDAPVPVNDTPPDKSEDIPPDKTPTKPPPPSDKQIDTDKVPDKTPDKSVDQIKPSADKSQDYEPPKVAKPSELRNWAYKMGAKAKEAAAEISKLNERIKAMEVSQSQPENNKALVEELASAKKKLDEYESQMRLTNYERSSEYQEKYVQPYQEALQQAYADVVEFIAYTRDPNDPDEVVERPATKEDFNEIYHLPTGQAFKRAKELFGEAAMAVIAHKQKIQALARKATTAIEEHKQKAGEWEQQIKAQQAQSMEAASRMFELAREHHIKKNGEMFVEKDGDAEGNDLLNKGRAFASMLFAGNENMTPQQIAMRDARAFNWIAAHPRLLRDLSKAKAQLVEMQKTIDSLRGSSPGKITPTGEPTPKGDGGWEEEFDKVVK